ncbi:MAG: hypothetical protein MRERV_4c080 [Mycoplasmataceae bacterium RV_VA103A]|nr:MAG: hypothetical protein MRERV_11c037 [Mycoplasmataceae bacterium RV_VA103A]KLL05174.1 MAG: hypothetical protein MRERV_4c080 [Mycoplasmataceae bacterium RV_VA103A]
MLQKLKDNWQPLLIGIVIGAAAVYCWNKYQTNQ